MFALPPSHPLFHKPGSLTLSLLSIALQLSLSQADTQTNKQADRDRQTDSSVVYFWRGKVILRCYLMGLLPDWMSQSLENNKTFCS